MMIEEARRALLPAVGRPVRTFRLTQDGARQKLDVAAGLSRSFLFRIEHGSDVDALRLWRVADMLGLPASEQLDRDEAKSRIR